MCPACLRVAGRARAERWKFSRSPSPATRDARPPMTSSPIPAARSQYLLDLLAQVSDPRKRRGRRHSLAGLLATGIAAVIAGSRSFAAIGQWAADAGEEVLAGLGAARGPAEGVHVPARVRPGQRGCARPGPRCLAVDQGRAGRRAAGDRDRRRISTPTYLGRFIRPAWLQEANYSLDRRSRGYQGRYTWGRLVRPAWLQEANYSLDRRVRVSSGNTAAPGICAAVCLC